MYTKFAAGSTMIVAGPQQDATVPPEDRAVSVPSGVEHVVEV